MSHHTKTMPNHDAAGDTGVLLLRLLTRHLRVASTDQVAAIAAETRGDAEWFGSWLRRQHAAGALGTASVMAHPPTEAREPMAVWQPGLAVPDLASIAHRAGQRWSGPARATECVWATESAVDLVGGHPGRHPRASEATHDLHVAAVYLRMRRELPTRACSWRSDAVILADRSLKRVRANEKVPDAVVRDGRARTAIETVGQYSTEKLRAFHAYCERARMGYELW